MSSIFTVHRQPYGEVMNPISPDSVRFHDKNGNVTEVRMADGMVNIHVGGVTVSAEHLEDLIRQMAKPPAEAQAQGGGEVELRHMVAKLAAHVRPTCGELWAEAERLLNRTAPPSAPVGVEGFEQWYARVDARFWNNWDACNAAYHAGKRSALAQQPAADDSEQFQRGWQAGMLAGRDSVQPAADNRICSVCDGGPGNDGPCLCGERRWEQPAAVKGLLTCYQCGKTVTWLAPDSRCGDCTRLTPDEVRGQ